MKVKRLGILALASLLSLATTTIFYTNNYVEEFVDSTDSNDSLFGKSIEAKNNKLVNLENMVKPKLGYQVAYTDSNLDGNNDYVSIRFTAAIRSLDGNCVWTRALYDEDGLVYTPLKEKEFEVTTGYTGVTSNGEITYATDVLDEDGNHPYNYFVVYTLLNIPLDTYSNYYLDCMLNISDDTDSINSSVGSIKVDLSDSFSYEKNDDLTYEKDGNTFSVKSSLDKEELTIPTFASNKDYRLPVTKVLDGAFSNKEELKRVIASDNIVNLEDTFTNSPLFEGFYTTINYGDLVFDDSITNKVYYYSDSCKNYNAWHYVSNTISTDYEHNPDEAVIENDTATCESDGTKDLVTYCSDCGIELSRETVISYAKGHDYIEEVESFNGHTHTKHECTYCHDFYYDNLVVDYTKNYDYIAFNEYDEYLEYKDILNTYYSELYDGCMNVINSDLDYTESDYITTNYYEIDINVLSNFVSSFMNNNPQFYFLDNQYSYSYYGNPYKYAIYLRINEEFYLGEVREEIENNLLLFEKDVTSKLEKDMTDYDKALLIHDYLCDNNFYQFDSEGHADSSIKSHSIWGIIDMDINTGTVCEGYSKAYQYLSNLVGLETISVVGMAGQGELGGHAWNYTKIDGSWYGVDVTWDDQDNYTYHDYFLCSKSFLANAGYSWNYGAHQAGNSDITINGSYFQVLLPELSENYYMN